MKEPLPLAYYGHPVLRQQAKPIEQITEELREFAQHLVESMIHHDGCGLAAPQVHRSIRMFAMQGYLIEPDGSYTLMEPEVILNPVLIEPSIETEFDEEGCLSIPGIRGSVERPRSITLQAIDLDGNPIERRLDGINARIVMHETDHLNGRFFHERMPKRERESLELRIKANQHLFGKASAKKRGR